MLPETVIEWRGLTLYGTDGPGRRTFRTLEGWEDSPSVRRAVTPRPTSHGAFAAETFAQPREVRVSGRLFSEDARDALLHEWQQHTPVGGVDSLTITHAGRTLAVQATLVERREPRKVWGAGFLEWTLAWECTDPFRYGVDDKGDTAGLPLLTGGLEFDLFTDGDGADLGYLEFGDPGDETGRVLVQNDGNADAWPIFLVGGDLPNGFAIQEVATGRRLMFADAVSPGAAVGIDSASGRVLMAAQVNTNTARFELRGNADRSGRLLLREFTPVPPGGSREFAFQAAPYDAGASMRVFLQDTYW